MSQFAVTNYTDTYTIYELTEAGTDSRVLVCPERGGIVIGCQLRGKELFYLDKATFEDPKANIRGGNPVLFPICGPVQDSVYEWNGKTYRMGQHGVARNASWEVAGISTEGEASVTLRLRAGESTLEAYPFDFELEFTYALVDGRLHTRQTYRNLGDNGPMPFYAGFHPYFAIEGGKDIPYETDATRYVDYNDNVVKPYNGSVDLEPMVESFCLLDAKKSEIAFPVGGGTRVRLTYDPIFKYVVIWSLKDRPFVCVEPWMAQPLEMNRREELVMLAPGEELQAGMTIGCES
ncbi:aldose epimerase [Paenibacillus sp. LHD-117]|uniref:aldose epimerase family protein n=1 Tax=Paenibacillus sp. LHD-117 TaxID=3071412 RepID=UPI0027E02FF7|nr:aldose epimerase [Paenibacillus sp. LHD-117]MDQ6423195.1 aldose epimerase [Paenibacillus sp. LHD-117]